MEKPGSGWFETDRSAGRERREDGSRTETGTKTGTKTPEKAELLFSKQQRRRRGWSGSRK